MRLFAIEICDLSEDDDENECAIAISFTDGYTYTGVTKHLIEGVEGRGQTKRTGYRRKERKKRKENPSYTTGLKLGRIDTLTNISL